MMTTTDKEQLELAAKAADYGFVYKRQISDDAHEWTSPDGMLWQWNPLIDDGQALRLAVKLRLHITVWPDAIGIGTNGRGYEELKWTDDPYAATRIAIVRAAAEIGKKL